MRRVLVSLVVAACGGTPPPAPTNQGGPPAPLVATPASAQDVVVAHVNGKPVYGSCVEVQAARGASKQDALQQCIDFELLAQLSEKYATDPEVVSETRTAIVNIFVAREFEDKLQKPADFGGFFEKIVEKNKRAVVHGEARASAYLRIPVAKTATPAEDAAAKAIADEAAAALANERGLMAPHLADFAARVIGTRAKYETAAVPLYLNEGGLVPEYAKPLFAIKEVGRTWPTAVRTQWGWDVILWTDVVPAENPTPDEIVKKALPDVKRVFFPLWTQQIAQRSGTVTKVFDDNLPLLENQ